MPVGNWWAGVVTTARTPDARSGFMAIPSPSTGSGTAVTPAEVYSASC